MATLDDHFGEDASLGESARAHIESYLVANAGRHKDAQLRITAQRWFLGEHDGRGFERKMSRYGAKTPADCLTCHQAAERGFFDID